MDDYKFPTWAVILLFFGAAFAAFAALAGGLFIGYQWGRSSGRAQAMEELAGMRFAAPAHPFLDQLPQEFLRPNQAGAGTPFLGVEFRVIDPEFAEQEQLPVERGALITNVLRGTPADEAGLEAGDIVVAVDGRSLTGDRSLAGAIGQLQPGDRVELSVIRDNEELEIVVTLGRRP